MCLISWVIFLKVILKNMFDNQVFFLWKKWQFFKTCSHWKAFYSFDWKTTNFNYYYYFFFRIALRLACKKSTKASQNVARLQPVSPPSGRRGWRRWWGWGEGGADCTNNTTGYLHAATVWTLAATATPPSDWVRSEADNTKRTLFYRHCEANSVIVTCIFLRMINKLYFLDGLSASVTFCNVVSTFWKLDLFFCYLDIGAVSCHECKPATQMLSFLCFFFLLLILWCLPEPVTEAASFAKKNKKKKRKDIYKM